jgi:hypothetical protein
VSNQIKIFREINILAGLNYKSEQNNHVEFLSSCHRELAEYFKNLFGDSFIFSALSYASGNMLHHIDEENNNSYIFNENFVKSHLELKSELQNYKGEIANGESISMTKILLNKNRKSYKDLFFINTNDTLKEKDDSESIFKYLLLNFNNNKVLYYKNNRATLDSFYDEFFNDYDNKDLYDKYVWNHHKLANLYKLSNDNKDFLLHYIKPSIIEIDHGLLLSLATNRALIEDELAFVNLILYRIVSQTVSEKMKEVEKMKTKTMFSLTTHSLKTHLNTTVIKTKNTFNDKLDAYPQLKSDFEEHSIEVDTLFHLTTLLSLIDKIDNPDKFKEAAIEVLFSKNLIKYNLKQHLEKFNKRHIERFPIEISPEIEIVIFPLKIYGLYFGEKLFELLFNTVFENILAHGKPSNKVKNLSLEFNTDNWIFSNEIVNEIVEIDEQKVKGNLSLFKKLIEETKSGNLNIKSENYTFIITIKPFANG